MVVGPVEFDVRAIGEAFRVGILHCGFAGNRLAVRWHVREGVIGNGQVALLDGALRTRPRLGLRQCSEYQAKQKDQAEAHHNSSLRTYWLLIPECVRGGPIRLSRNFHFDRPDRQPYTPEALPSQPECPSSHNLSARETDSPVRAHMQ